MRRLVLAAILAALTLGVAPMGHADAVTTPTVTAKVYAYGADPMQRFTATSYSARTASPWVLLIHGGSWINGSEANMAGIGSIFFGRGWQTFNLTYRMGPGVTFAMQRDDVDAARRYIVANAAKFGVNPARGTVVGFSAGGHLAAVAANRGGFASSVLICGVLQPQRLATMPGPDGEQAYIAARAAAMVGEPYSVDSAAWADFEPQNGIGAATPPTYVMYGADDIYGNAAASRSYAYWLGYYGVTARRLVGVAGLGHSALVFTGDWARQDAVIQFVKAHWSAG